MHPVNRLRLLALPLILALLSACSFLQSSSSPATLAPAAASPAATTNAAAASAIESPAPASTVQVTATAIPSPSPVPTETRPPPLVAIPPAWQEAAERAVEQLPSWSGRLLASDTPSELLAAGQAQVALAPVEEGYPAGRQPVAIAVPFASDLAQVTLAQAQEIVANGHPQATVVPWAQLEPSQRALYVNGRHISDPQYPLQQPWSVLAAPGYEPAAAALAEALRQQSPFSASVQLAAVGDVMLDRALGTAIASGDLAFPFAHVRSILQGADLALANLECALGDVGEPAQKSYTFRAPSDAARSLAAAGIDIVSLANNHALDFGPSALLQGIDLLRGSGVAAVGAGPDSRAARAPAIVTSNGLTLAILAYVNVPVEGQPPYFDTQSWTASESAPGLAWANVDEISSDVAAAREKADHVVVLLHSGYEYVPGPSPEQRAAAQAAIDTGAALVIGHHAHILQGVEFYGEGVIVYGLGNFAFTITGPPETAILQVWLDEHGVRQLEFVPAIVQPSGQPRLATEEEAAAIRRRIYALSAGLQ